MGEHATQNNHYSHKNEFNLLEIYHCPSFNYSDNLLDRSIILIYKNAEINREKSTMK